MLNDLKVVCQNFRANVRLIFIDRVPYRLVLLNL